MKRSKSLPLVRRWLDGLGLGQYADVFAENDIDEEVLPELDDADLEKLGVTLGHRKKLLKAISALPGDGTSITPSSNIAAAPAQQPGAISSQPERRQLTVMFCDLVDSTALANRLDPEDVRDIILGYQDVCAGVISRFGGYIARYMGDGLLVYFGFPRAHEDDAERAVRAGLGILEAVGMLDAPMGVSLQVRIGVATGLVVVGDIIGEVGAQEYAVVGETPNLAARLQNSATPGTVVINASARQLLSGGFECEDLGILTVKGIPDPIRTWRVVEEHAVESRFDAAHTTGLTPFVGREQEVALLIDRWEQVVEGEGQVVLLSGEAGIGKSRITDTLREWLSGKQIVRLKYQCSAHHQNSSLYPAIRQLEFAAGFSPADAPEQKIDKLQALLERSNQHAKDATPLLADLMSIPTGERHRSLEMPPQYKKQRIFEILIDQFTALTKADPVLFTFEDAHWADPTTLEFMDQIVERVQGLRALVLVTFRPDFAPRWGKHMHCTALALNRLGRSQCTRLIKHIAGGEELPPEVLELVLSKTDGIPLFAEELTKALLESGVVTKEDGRYILTGSAASLAIPESLQDSLMARLDHLDRAKEIAQIGAAIGREFSRQLIEEVTPLFGHNLQQALDSLIASELVFRRGGPPDEVYIFKHALIQDTAYQSLLRSSRCQIHTRIAAALETQFPETVKIEPELLAHHYTKAGLEHKAIGYWMRAAQRSLERSANAEAVAAASSGLTCLEAEPETRNNTRQELALQTMLGVALMATEGYGAAKVGEVYKRARELSRQIDDPVQQFQALWGFWRFHVVGHDLPTAHSAVEELVSEAERSNDEALLLLGRCAVGITLFYRNRFASARQQFEHAISLYDPDRHGSLAFQYGQNPGAIANSFLALTLWIMGYPDQAVQICHQALSAAKDPFSMAYALWWTSLPHQFVGDRHVVREQAQRCVSLSSEYGFSHWRAAGAILEEWAGNGGRDTAADSARIASCIEELEHKHSRRAQPYFLYLLAHSHAHAENIREARNAIAEALEQVRLYGELWWEAELHRTMGELSLRLSPQDSTGAEESIKTAVETARHSAAKSLELRATTSLARLWVERGKRVEARDMLTSIYNWFTEGFETADLKEAQALLATLR